MSELGKGEDEEEAALKWLALAALHGINNRAKKIKIYRSESGEVKVVAKYREAELPSPGPDIGQKIIDDLRQITHLEADKGKTLLALGIRDSSIELKVKAERDEEGEKITLKFPE
ncbi:MAG: hypothetical protein U5R49_27190 [Deltaproteobacteria bacterium]|nr:hypothetical protein [Deltaproteobacteria bacterium]